MVHRFFRPTNKATRILVPAVRSRAPRRANYSKGPPRSPSRERHNASARRTSGRRWGGGGRGGWKGLLYRGEGLRQAYTLHMGIGNARRSRRIIRTPSAIPKLCWMHANCREGTHPCTSYIYGVFRDASANFNDRFSLVLDHWGSLVDMFDHRILHERRAIPSYSLLEFKRIFITRSLTLGFV